MIASVRATMIGVLLLGVPSTQAATVEGYVSVDGRAATNAVVYLEGRDAAQPVAPGERRAQERVVMDQKNLAFEPDVLPVERGTVVEFTNSDDVRHNVFSPSVISGKFDLGTYGPGATRTVTLDRPGDVRVLCNIHMEMEAHILVLDTHLFSKVAGDGRYRIADAPAGRYTLKVWQRRWLPFNRTVDLPASGSVTVDIAAGQ